MPFILSNYLHGGCKWSGPFGLGILSKQISNEKNYKCQNTLLSIDFQASSYLQPLIKKRNDLFSLVGRTTLNCNPFLTNQKQWLIFKVNPQNGLPLTQIHLTNNPTINYAQLVIQPQTLMYGLYQFEYTVTMTQTNSSAPVSSQIRTYVQIEPSGLILSTLSLSQGIYGGTIEISRGQHQEIPFNPYLNSYDIDSTLVITTLTFKYSCRIIDSGVVSGEYPQMPGTNASIYMDEMKLNYSLHAAYDICFNTTGLRFIFYFCLLYIL